jgi:hypothetical protein
MPGEKKRWPAKKRWSHVWSAKSQSQRAWNPKQSIGRSLRNMPQWKLAEQRNLEKTDVRKEVAAETGRQKLDKEPRPETAARGNSQRPSRRP